MTSLGGLRHQGGKRHHDPRHHAFRDGRVGSVRGHRGQRPGRHHRRGGPRGHGRQERERHRPGDRARGALGPASRPVHGGGVSCRSIFLAVAVVVLMDMTEHASAQPRRGRRAAGRAGHRPHPHDQGLGGTEPWPRKRSSPPTRSRCRTPRRRFSRTSASCRRTTPSSSIVDHELGPQRGQVHRARWSWRAPSPRPASRCCSWRPTCAAARLAGMLNVRPAAGAYAVLTDAAPLKAPPSPTTTTPNLYFLDVEPNIPNPADILSSKRYRKLVAHAGGHATTTWCSTRRPWARSSDAAILSTMVDGTVIGGEAQLRRSAPSLRGRLRAAEEGRRQRARHLRHVLRGDGFRILLRLLHQLGRAREGAEKPPRLPSGHAPCRVSPPARSACHGSAAGRGVGGARVGRVCLFAGGEPRRIRAASPDAAGRAQALDEGPALPYPSRRGRRRARPARSPSRCCEAAQECRHHVHRVHAACAATPTSTTTPCGTLTTCCVAHAGGFPLSMGFEVNHAKLMDLGMEWADRLHFDGIERVFAGAFHQGEQARLRAYTSAPSSSLQAKGYQVIIAHPERYLAIQEDVGGGAPSGQDGLPAAGFGRSSWRAGAWAPSASPPGGCSKRTW